MRVISEKKLRDFWQTPGNEDAEEPLRAWNRIVRQSKWGHFADLKNTYRTADKITDSNKTVFDIGGNKFRIVAVIDFERHKVFVRHVLSHAEYDKAKWKNDTFGDDWGKPIRKKKARDARRNQ